MPAVACSSAISSSANALHRSAFLQTRQPRHSNPHSASRIANLLPIAVSFIEGFRTPASVQAASSPWAGIRNPQQTRSFRDVRVMSALPSTATERRTWRHFAFGPGRTLHRRKTASHFAVSDEPPSAQRLSVLYGTNNCHSLSGRPPATWASGRMAGAAPGFAAGWAGSLPTRVGEMQMIVAHEAYPPLASLTVAFLSNSTNVGSRHAPISRLTFAFAGGPLRLLHSRR